MLDKDIIKKFLQDKLSDWKVEIPNDIDLKELVEVFCLYAENDYYEWLKDNAKSFFAVGTDGIVWDLIRERMKRQKQM